MPHVVVSLIEHSEGGVPPRLAGLARYRERTSSLDRARGVDVGVELLPAEPADEARLGLAVGFVGVAAAGALSAGVGGVDCGDGDAVLGGQRLQALLEDSAAGAGDEPVEPAGQAATAEVEVFNDQFSDCQLTFGGGELVQKPATGPITFGRSTAASTGSARARRRCRWRTPTSTRSP